MFLQNRFLLLFPVSFLASETIITAPKIRINLYEPPEIRWYNAFQTLNSTQKDTTCNSLEEIVETYLSGPLLRNLANLAAKDVKDAIPREYLSEIDGLHRATHEYCQSRKSQKITVEEFYIMNLVYEIAAFNTTEEEVQSGDLYSTD